MTNRRIACWMSEKKIQKVNWNEFEKALTKHGFTLFKLDLTTSIQCQGTFHVLLHKFTDIIAAAEQGDPKCNQIIENIENYLRDNPHVITIDPISNVRQLLNRYVTYRKINSTNLHRVGVFTPNFCEIDSTSVVEMANQLKNAGVSYPFISKPALGHGSRAAHEMSIIFNEKGLKDCRTPCVAQTFIPHDAVLYKIFCVGDQVRCVERPSLKNFRIEDNWDTIHFHGSDISKAGSTNALTRLEPHEQINPVKIDQYVVEQIASSLRSVFGMDLLGIDVVIENKTGRFGIIDVNAYPGYDGFPDFYDALVDLLDQKIRSSDSDLPLKINHTMSHTT